MSKIREYGIDPGSTLNALDQALQDTLQRKAERNPGITTASLYAGPATVTPPSPGACKIEGCGGTMTMAYVKDAQAVLPFCPNCNNVDLG